MPGFRFGRGDALALLTLVGSSVIIASPIVSGGYLTYIDNPVHLAEIGDLSRSHARGWSEIGFVGFPLGTLHSPLWYPLFAALMRAGMPLGPMYATLLVVSFMAPSLALYFVARRRLNAVLAGALAYLLLVQPPSIWGIGSPLAGMWTHALACAGLILLADLYARRRLTSSGHFVASLLLCVVTLTHAFAWPALAVLIGVTTWLHYRAETLTRRELERRALGWGVAAVASAKYWLTFLMVATPDAAPQQRFTVKELATRLFLPSDPMFLAEGMVKESIRWDLHLTDALPMITLAVVGVLGVRARAADVLGKTGFWLALGTFGALVLHHYVPLKFLGPVAWRLLTWVNVGCALSGISVLAQWRSERLVRVERWAGVVLAIAGCALARWWGGPLRHDSPSSLAREVSEIRELWSWLAKNARPEWGRIYLADTFGTDWRVAGLSHSHVLALTSEYTHLPQIGTYYSVVPYSHRVMLSEFGALYGAFRPPRTWLLEAMDKTNAGVLVVSNDAMKPFIRAFDAFDELYQVSHYSVFRRRGAEVHPISPLAPTNLVTNESFSVGEIAFDLSTRYPRTRVLAKTSYHPWWRMEGVPGGTLRESPEGFLVVDRIPVGSFHVRLWYQPSSVPTLVTAIGWALFGGWGLLVTRNARRRGERTAGVPA